MQKTGIAPAQITVWNGNARQSSEDLVAVEEPLEIKLHYGDEVSRTEVCLAVTMRTPGNDAELALGFLFTEGIIEDVSSVISAHHCENVTREDEKGNVLRVRLKPEVEFDLSGLQRNFYISSSCGVCGKTSVESVMQHCIFNQNTAFKISGKTLCKMPVALNKEQLLFGRTGGIHASAAFDNRGNLLALREDVGRHNALDKLIGYGLQSQRFEFSDCVLLLSGRLSFELVQKAAIAGFPVVAGVGAPSSLAIQLAQKSGITLIGFLKQDKFNGYSFPNRITD
jgi:FdhD protein